MTATCICGRPLPVVTPPRVQPTTCCYWHALVAKGTFTLEQVEPMVSRIREPMPEADDLFGGAL